jgi:hypothetical protein
MVLGTLLQYGFHVLTRDRFWGSVMEEAQWRAAEEWRRWREERRRRRDH